MIDVLVAGGGPVGLAAAIEARMAGLSVVVIEPRTGPIDKACGEGLMPAALPLLRRLGVDPPGMPIRGIGYLAGERQVVHRFAGDPGRGVRRTVLHEALAERARELGITTVQGRVDELRQDARGVRAGDLEARWLFGCDGLHSEVARMAGLALPAPSRGRRYGIRRHFRVQPWSDLVEVHYGRRAEVYITPIAPDLVGVAALGPRGAGFEETLASIPGLARRLDGAAAVTPARGAGPFRQRTRARTAGHVLLLGDASGYVDALTGEGLRLGFDEARAAVAAIQAGDTRLYEESWREIVADSWQITSRLVAWARSPLRGAIVPVAARVPRVFGGIVERLAR